MSRMHASRVFFVRCSDRRNKKTKQTKRRRIFFWSREKKREKCQLEERSKFERNSWFDHHRRQILTFLSSFPMMIKDDDLFAENATFNAPTCSQTHFTHTFIKYVCICSTTIHRVPRERRREICFVEETIEENSTMQFTRRGREEIGRGFKQK